MYDYIQLGVMVALLMGSGVWLFLRSKFSSSRVSFRGVGAALIVMTFILIAFAILSFFAESSHNVGH
ncbi:hypothetical protein [Paenibacillus puerhi]|uniref:hypothetical protein n=1 Tax=Paenibacillus puerhi TaxID=2692622 RepID=UPI00135A4CDF|nr:hypothetical protein [Paenibacillus puerhi]